VPLSEFRELLEIKLIGQFSQRVVCLLGVTEATQSFSQPLPAIRHFHPNLSAT
jgi:hypothetical protein